MSWRGLAKLRVATPPAAGRIPMPPGAAGPAPVAAAALPASIVSALCHEPPSLMRSATVPGHARPSLLAVPTRPADHGSPERLRSRTYVCYCDGIRCNALTETALKLLTLGFQVREPIGGLDWWKRDGYATAGENGRPGRDLKCS